MAISPWLKKIPSSRLLKNTHLLRYAHPSSLQRTEKYASFLRISRALHLAVFEQPGKKHFFNNLLVLPLVMQERLHKVIARAGRASRREAERLISEGRVRVNSSTVTELGTKVDPAHDMIWVDGKKLTAAPPFLYILLNKPAGYVSTVKDPEKRPTVVDLLKGVSARVFPVGRLDYDAEGLILLTNDGALAHRLHHPRYGIRRTYDVKVRGVPCQESLARFGTGIRLEDGMTLPARAEFLREALTNSWLRVTLREGRNRQVKRMCAAVGHGVIKIRRVKFATLTLVGLKPGEYRFLTPREVKGLYKLVSLDS